MPSLPGTSRGARTYIGALPAWPRSVRFECGAKRKGIALLVLGAALAGCGDDGRGRVCTEAGCGAIAWVNFFRFSDSSVLDNTSIEVCINDRCVGGAVPVLSNVLSAGARFNGPLTVDLSVYSADGQSNMLDLTIQEIERIDDVRFGDVYTVSLKRGDGTTFVSRRWTATYLESYPNGVECGPRCVTATLTPAQ